MAQSKLKLDTRRMMNDGTFPIVVNVGYGTNLMLPTGQYAKREEWNDAESLFTGKGARTVNSVLDALLSRISLRIAKMSVDNEIKKYTKKQLRTLLMSVDENPDVSKPGDKSTSLRAIYIRTMETKHGRTRQLYEETLKKLDDFKDAKVIGINDVTRAWLLEFDAWLMQKGLKPNSRAIHMRNLRNAFNFALDEEITQNYPFRRFKIKREETAMLVLTSAQMQQLHALTDFGTRAYDEEYRDMFLLMFYLIGINLIDLAGLTEENIVNGRIEYRRAKTHKLYSIKIEPEAAAILEKYKGERHLLRCFDRYASHRDYNAHFNDGLKRLGECTEGGTVIEPRMSSYWSRYTWATVAAELDIPRDTISEALGHEYGSKVTRGYIQFNHAKVDEANRKVIDYVTCKS